MTQGRATSYRFAVLLSLLMALCGCSFRGERIQLDSLTLDVAEQANDDTPIAVDFVAVHDPGFPAWPGKRHVPTETVKAIEGGHMWPNLRQVAERTRL